MSGYAAGVSGHRLFTAAALAFALTPAAGACGGGATDAIDGAAPDARTVDAPIATIDAPVGPTCTEGGDCTVVVDLGTDAERILFSHGWFNHGHETKACFAIDVVLSTRAAIEGSYLSDPQVLEISFAAEPVPGTNEVQLHLHTPDLRLRGFVEVLEVSADEISGIVDGVGSVESVRGKFVARRCENIIDPCI